MFNLIKRLFGGSDAEVKKLIDDGAIIVIIGNLADHPATMKILPCGQMFNR